MLKQLIAHLQQMLVKIEAQISVAAAHRGPGGSPNPALGGLQGEASTIQGEISSATEKMAELLKSQGQSAGALVNDQA
ncbi:hypothetical protein [Paraburkholderia solisilvae]|uniref:hypothetical protein n=1 Tax=Paraburkholderia solisilvae TaxID=624376 RepID=UPI001583AB92|nr:hypothetical protein [Paraburkholderia solisilvae]